MAATDRQSSAARRGILGLLMLALLAATVGSAWLLQSASVRRARAAADILAGLCGEGLENFWPEKLQIDWYVIHAEAGPIGWRAVANGRTENGFAGVKVDVMPRRKYTLREEWLLNDDATEGAYKGADWTSILLRSETDIHLKGGVVRVLQHNFNRSASSLAPENYMPEGLFEPLVRRVAAGGADTQFAMVFNEKPNPAKVIEFGTLRIRHLGRAKDARGDSVDRVRVSGVRTASEHASTYELDPNGRIVMIRDSAGVRWVPAKLSDVTKLYGNAAAYLLKLMPAALKDEAELLLLDALQTLPPERLGPADQVGVGSVRRLGEGEVH